MPREQLVEIFRDVLEHARAGTQELAPDLHTVPSANYTDPERWEREMARVFRRVPLTLGVAADVAAPGDYRAFEFAGVPVLLLRGQDGVLRSFVNACRHRGAQVVPDGEGSGRRFACPYHAWTYDTEGALVGVLDRDDVGPLDTDCLGLVELPVEERAGLVFGGLTPGMELHLDDFLAGYDEMLDHLGLAGAQVVGRQTIDGPNWKVAYDGYLDFYHLPILHKNTFGPDYSNKAVYRAWGPHQRVLSPDHRVLALDGIAEDDWPLQKLIGGVWTIFPHISIATFDIGQPMMMLSQLIPGPGPRESRTVQHFLCRESLDDEQQAQVGKTMAFLEHVVRDEDYFTGIGITRGLATGAFDQVIFGRNEGGGQRFHRWVDALVDTGDDALADLYRSGI